MEDNSSSLNFSNKRIINGFITSNGGVSNVNNLNTRTSSGVVNRNDKNALIGVQMALNDGQLNANQIRNEVVQESSGRGGGGGQTRSNTKGNSGAEGKSTDRPKMADSNSSSNNNYQSMDLNNRGFTNASIALNGGTINTLRSTNIVPAEVHAQAMEKGHMLNVALTSGKDAKINQAFVRNIILPPAGGAKSYTPTATAAATAAGTKVYYNMNSASGEGKRGLCLVLNYQNYTNRRYFRHGSDKDVARIKKLFGDKLNYEVKVFDDLRDAGETEAQLICESKRIKAEYSSFILFILAHGEPGYFICDIDLNGNSSDDQKLSYNRVLEIFDGTNCRKLIGKPKLFFVQACQGEANDPGTRLASDSAQGEAGNSRNAPEELSADAWERFVIYDDPSNIPAKADQLVFCCCYTNHFSLRHSVNGTWFIQDLCKVFDDQWKSQDLDPMLTAVKEKVAARQAFQVEEFTRETAIVKQMPTVKSNTLTKNLKFY